jgi:uncharacterized membrane protein YkoI
MYYKLLFTTVILITGCTTSTNLSPAEHQSLHPYNQKPSLKIKQIRQMHKLHEIDEKEAERIAQTVTGEKVLQLKLKHEGQILFYFIITPSYQLHIDAKKGTILKKENHE